MYELIVDNFAGGGGASKGIELATGRSVDIAINHNPSAILMHKTNHPNTVHYNENVWDIDIKKVCRGYTVGLAWFSPDCKHFSKAKGGKPRDKNIRGLAWVAVKWAATVHPRVIMLENVEEFKTWGPLLPDGMPDINQSGRTFHSFINALKYQGYEVDYRELRACDYGAPTKRKRFCLIARCDGKPIVWPEPTHGDPKSEAVKYGKLLPWHTAAEIIDWSKECPSIFTRKKALADNTMKRIARGMKKFVIDDAKPFIVEVNHKGDGFRGQSLNEPMNTITAKHGRGMVTPYIAHYKYGNEPESVKEPFSTVTSVNGHYVVAPVMTSIGQTGSKDRSNSVNEPLRTIVSKNEHCLAMPVLTKFHVNDSRSSVAEPLPTITAGGKSKRPAGAPHALGVSETKMQNLTDGDNLAAPVLMSNQFNNVGSSMKEPTSTLLTGNHKYVVEADLKKQVSIPSLVQIGYGEREGQAPRVMDVKEPLNTVVANSNKFAAAMPILTQYHSYEGNDVRGQKVDNPLMTVDRSNRYALTSAYISQYYGGGYTGSGSDLNAPTPTITAKDHNALITSHMIQLNNHCDGQSVNEPVNTVTAGAGHFGEVRSFLTPYYGNEKDGRSVDEPLGTVVSKDRFALVTVRIEKMRPGMDYGYWPEIRAMLNAYCGYTMQDDEVIVFYIKGEQYFIIDIGMRMLEPYELFAAQGCPSDYIIDHDYTGTYYPKSEQVARCGNMVCPPMAEALVRANLPEMCKGAEDERVRCAR